MTRIATFNVNGVNGRLPPFGPTAVRRILK